MISLLPISLQLSNRGFRGDERTGAWESKLGGAVVKASFAESWASATEDAAKTSDAVRRALDCIMEGSVMLCEYLGLSKRTGDWKAFMRQRWNIYQNWVEVEPCSCAARD